MDSDYGQVYARLYREHWWWRAREEFLMDMFAHLPLAPQPRVLDIGCGDGLFFDRLIKLGARVEGLESSAELVSAATRQRYPIHLGPFDESFVPDQRYDLVLMLDVLEHLPQPLSALRQAAALLEPKGYLVITVPAFLMLWTAHDVLNHHLTRYTRRTLATLVAQAPLEICQQRYFFHWLAPLKLLTRCKERLWQTPPQPPRIAPRWLNAGLIGLSRLEARCFSRHPLPFGSSLAMVCRRTTTM